MWSVVIPLALRIVNSTYSDEIGCAPNDLVLYRPPDLEHNRFDPHRDHTELGPVNSDFLRKVFTAHERMLDVTSERLSKRQLFRQSNRPPSTAAVPLPGQYVLLRYPVRAPSKLTSRLAGPFLLDKCIGRLCTIRGLTDGNEAHEVDIERIVPFVHYGTPTEAAKIAGQDLGEKQVRAILGHRGNPKGKRGDLEFKVEWFDSDITWEPWSNVRRLSHIDAYINEYPDLHRLRTVPSTKDTTKKK
jgi:hypothetical protein